MNEKVEKPVLKRGVADPAQMSGREGNQVALFEHMVLPHLDAAYNLARWLARSEHDAEDIVQEACLRAFKFFDGYRGGDSRRWLLTIERNTFYDSLQQSCGKELTAEFDEEIHSQAGQTFDPESLLLRNADRQLVRRALEELPLEFREVVDSPGIGRVSVQGDRRGHRRSFGHCDVSPGSRPQVAS